MTKSEARAVAEACGRALRAIGINAPWHAMDTATREAMQASIKVTNDEIKRVFDMACAELEK